MNVGVHRLARIFLGFCMFFWEMWGFVHFSSEFGPENASFPIKIIIGQAYGGLLGKNFLGKSFLGWRTCWGKMRSLRTDRIFVLKLNMSNSKNPEVSVPIVEVVSSSSTSTLVDRQADESSSTSSDESMNSKAGQILPIRMDTEVEQTQPTSLGIGDWQTLPTRLDIDDGIIRVLSV